MEVGLNGGIAQPLKTRLNNQKYKDVGKLPCPVWDIQKYSEDKYQPLRDLLKEDFLLTYLLYILSFIITFSSQYIMSFDHNKPSLLS